MLTPNTTILIYTFTGKRIILFYKIYNPIASQFANVAMEWRTCVVILCVTAVLADDEWREVKTAQGPVRGRKHPSEDLYTFFNIPYATAPVGVDKFKVCMKN